MSDTETRMVYTHYIARRKVQSIPWGRRLLPIWFLPGTATAKIKVLEKRIQPKKSCIRSDIHDDRDIIMAVKTVACWGERNEVGRRRVSHLNQGDCRATQGRARESLDEGSCIIWRYYTEADDWEYFVISPILEVFIERDLLSLAPSRNA